MRHPQFIFLFVLFFLQPCFVAADENKTTDRESTVSSADIRNVIDNNDEEVIAELELMEMLELLQNLDTIAVMEDQK